MLKFLNLNNAENIQKYIPLFGQISAYRIVSYLNFQINQKGDKIVNTQYLKNNTTYNHTLLKRGELRSLNQYLSTINYQYLLTQSYLIGLFQNHLVNYSQCQDFMESIVNLSLLKKQDIANFMGSSLWKIELKQNRGVKQYFNPFQRFNVKIQYHQKIAKDSEKKKFFILEDQPITKYEDLQNLLTKNSKFNQLPNIKKIICVDLKIGDIYKFNQKLLQNQKYFKQHDINIKNTPTIQQSSSPQQSLTLRKGQRIFKLLQYIYRKQRGNILMHSQPQYYSYFNTKMLATDNKILKQLNSLTPTQVFIMLQRRQHDTLQNSDCNVFSQFSENFVPRYLQQKDPHNQNKSKKGFSLQRYISKVNRLRDAKLIQAQLNPSM